MQIRANMSGESMQQILRLFTEEKAERIRNVNARIAGEQARGDVFHPSNDIEGLQYEFRTDRLINLPDHMREAIITHARESFSRGYGLATAKDGDRFAALQRSFVRDFQVSDRWAAMSSMSVAFRNEVDRIHDAVRQQIPGWTPGQRVPDEILTPILNGKIGFNATV